MASRFCNIKNNMYAKRYSLRYIGAGILLFSVSFVLTKIYNCSLCPIQNLFGIKCFGCGLTRGFICILALDFRAATMYNVMSIPLFLAIAVYMALLCLDILFSTEHLAALERFLSRRYMFVFYLMILIASAYLNHRL